MGSTAHTSIHPRGDATVHVHTSPNGFIGAVRVNGMATIQSTNPAHLRQLSAALDAAATEMIDRQFAAELRAVQA